MKLDTVTLVVASTNLDIQALW